MAAGTIQTVLMRNLSFVKYQVIESDVIYKLLKLKVIETITNIPLPGKVCRFYEKFHLESTNLLVPN